MSHIFFGEIRHHIWNAFSTHPPLPRRIRRLDPAWDGNYIRRAERRYAEGPLSEDAVRIGVGREALVLAAAASAAAADAVADARAGGGAGTAGAAGAAQADNLAALEAVCREPLGAMAVAFALLVVRQGDELDSALQFIDERRVQGLGEQVRALLEPVRRLRPPERFPLVAAAMPALKSLSGPQYQQFKNTLVLLIRADRRTDLFEWCLFQLLRHYLDPEYQRVTASRPRHAHLGKLRRPLRQVLSVLAHQGSGSSASAFAAAADSLGLHGLSLLAAEDCSVADFSEAVHTLADCYPLLKPRVLKAMVLAAEDDGEFCAAEREIVIAVAAVMDCPLPDELAL